MYRGLRPKMTIKIFIKIMGLAFLEYVRSIGYRKFIASSYELELYFADTYVRAASISRPGQCLTRTCTSRARS
jgi:hypothetical protein